MSRVVPALVVLVLVQVFPASWAITSGQDAAPGQFPYVVTIFNTIDKTRAGCGGVLITKYHVLSSGQCDCLNLFTVFGTIVIKAGQSNNKKDDSYVQTRALDKYAIYNNALKNSRLFISIKTDDIAVLKVKEAFQINVRVQLAELPPRGFAIQGSAYLSGFGSNSNTLIPSYAGVLQYVKVNIISNSVCQSAIRKVSLKNLFVKLDRERQICTGPLDRSVSACIGDSGNGLMQRNNNQTYVVAIVSWGAYPCGKKESPILYTTVAHYLDWIIDKIHNL